MRSTPDLQADPAAGFGLVTRGGDVAAIALFISAVLLLIVALTGIPARGTIASGLREFSAQDNVEFDLPGRVRLTIWPDFGFFADDVTVRDGDGGLLATAGRMQVSVSALDLLHGRMTPTGLTLTRPSVRLDTVAARLHRTLRPPRPGEQPAAASETGSLDRLLSIGTITARDARLVLADGDDQVTADLASVRLTTAPSSASGGAKVDGRVDANGRSFVVAVAPPPAGTDGASVSISQALPTDDAPSFRLTTKATRSGPALRFVGLDATIGRDHLAGTASISFAEAKAFVDAELTANRLDLTTLLGLGESGRDAPITLTGLGVVDNNVKLAASDLVFHGVHLAPAALDVSVLRGVLTIDLGVSRLYGGETSGQLRLDRVPEGAQLASRLEFSGVDVRSLLHDGFGSALMRGRARSTLDLRTVGSTPARLLSGLQGEANLSVAEGAVGEISIARIVRTLVDSVQHGWQEHAAEQTAFDTLSATLRVDHGVARSDNFNLTGPDLKMTISGSADLAAQSLDLRAEPRLLMGASRAGQPEWWSIGVPIVVKGPWSAPDIYTDVPGILDNPEAALGKLRETLRAAMSGK